MLVRQLNVLMVVLCAVLFCFGTLLGFNIFRQFSAADFSSRQVKQLVAMSNLDAHIKRMQFDVVQVQQYLTDYSATRGWNGLNTGLSEADSAALDFHKEVRAAVALARELNMPKVNAYLIDTEARFSPYYQTGHRMALAYSEGGTEAGNALMGDFDSTSDALVKAQQKAADGIGAANLSVQNQSVKNSHLNKSSAISFLFVSLLSGLVLIAAILGLAFVTYSKVLRPMGRLTNYLDSHVEFRDGSSVPEIERRDEIGAIANAIRASEVRAVEWDRERQLQGQVHEAERRQTAWNLAQKFEDAVGEIIRHVGESAKELQESATQLSATAHQTSAQSVAVSAAAEEATVSLTSVAGATEELGASVGEIARQVETSNQISLEAANEAKRATEVIGELDAVSASVHSVIETITALAAQTNLLALNATIESARAGEAGRGFAVVASEVKNLANRTATATTEIADKIAHMQEVGHNAVRVLRGISETIVRINDSSASIASAVEQQAAATNEIIVALNQASLGASEVTGNITGVADAAQGTGAAAAQVTAESAELLEDANHLQTTMESFLGAMRAA